MPEKSRSATASRYTTPLAAPPPPLHLLSAQQGRGTHNMHLPAYAGARHTLGPMFNDEEDGDDSAFIAQQMSLLGLDSQQQQQQRERGGGGQDGVRRRASTTQPGTNSRRGQRRQPQHQQPQQQPRAHHQQQHQHHSQQAPSASATAAAYHLLQAQQQALLQIGAAAPSQQAQILAAQQYQMQLQLAALQLQHQQQQQQQQYNGSPHARHSSSPNPQYHHTGFQQPLAQQQYPPATASASASGQRNQLAAQVQANLLARTRRQNNLDDAETRARFEAAPNVNREREREQSQGRSTSASTLQPSRPPSHPFAPLPLPAASSSSWRTGSNDFVKAPTPPSVPAVGPTRVSAPTSRFASAPTPTRGTSGASSSSDSLRASTEDLYYSGFSTEPTTAQTSPKSFASDVVNDKDTGADADAKTPSAPSIGLGRPLSVSSASPSASASARLRAWSTPLATTAPLVPQQQARGTSYPGASSSSVIVVRQPFGPPGNAAELQEKNFKAVLRKRAGLGLHMLNRRSSPLAPIIPLEEDDAE